MSRFICLKVVSLAICIGVLGTGCGTIVHGTTQIVPIATIPAGATVQIDNGVTLTTPTQTKLERKRDYILTITKLGYQTQTIPLNSVLSGWVAGNLVFGGLIDAVSGGAFTLTPEKVSVTLVPLGNGQSRDIAVPSGSLTTQQKLVILERLHKEGVVNDKEYQASKAKLNQDLKREVTGSG